MGEFFGGVADKIISIFESLITWMFKSLLEPFLGLAHLKDLIFGTKGGDLIWGTFQPTDLTGALVPTFYSMATLAGFAFVIFIVIYGMRLADASRNPLQRNELISFVTDLVMVCLVLFNLPLLYDILFTINQGIVNLFSGAYESNLDKLTLGDSLDGEDEGGNGVSDLIGQIAVQLVLLGLSIWANFYYFMRKVTLILLMALGPLMMVFYLNQRFRGMTGAWFKELVGSIFVQSIHSLVFWVIAAISASSDGLIETVIVYAIFIPVSEGLRNLIGMGGGMQGNLSKAGAMMGIGALSGMYGVAKGITGGQGVVGALKNGYNGIKGKGGNGNGAEGTSGSDTSDDTSSMLKNHGAEAGTDAGTTEKAEKMLQRGDFFSKGGKAVHGMAGSIAGMGLGPVGSIAGATAGSAVGGVVGGITGRAGSAALSGLAAIPGQFKKGREAGLDKMNARNADLEDNLANQMADHESIAWAKDNKESVMSNLQERFPDASPQELESKFNDIQSAQRQKFHQGAKNSIASMKQNGENMASGQSMVNASSQAMADQWGKDNQASFFADYDQNNGRKTGESQQDYQARRMSAFNEKKSGVQSAFAQAGQEYVKQNAVDGNEPIAKDKFHEHMSSAVGGMQGLGNVSNLSSAGKQAVDHVTGASILASNGKPNTPFVVGSLANAKTNQMKEAFVAQQQSAGISVDSAERDWDNNHKASVHAQNVQSAQSTLSQASQGIRFRANSDSIGVKLEDKTVGVIAGVGAATGITSIASVAKSMGQGSVAGFQSSDAQGFGGKVVSAIQGGYSEGVQQSAELQGGMVQAQKNFQNSLGYAGGVMMGAKGYRMGATAAAKFASPYQRQTQEAIQTPSEVIQMARTVTDPNGNQQIAPGAIRQVITPNESYIEVQTKGGSTEIVSRKGSGHSKLKSGEVVYQDLSVMNDSLVPVQSKGSQSSTYRLDSGGARIPSHVEVAQDPSSLLSSTLLGSKKAAPVQKQQVPIFNQKVDSGNFKVEEIKAQGLSNPRVVVEKNRQFVTAEKDGISYRVSPVFAGDSRLGSSQTIEIPVQADGARLAVKNSVPNSDVGALTSSNQAYYSSRSVEGLIISVEDMMDSKHMEHASQSAEKRRYLDQVRRKQGLLG
ncbi:type IV secretion system protein [Psychrobacillus sp. FSL H8-0510]|uniref:type IV secretion system protein n=1 Tax=Psychrobacillus sp. FSL H8-0510 TaxID=2921394 RepID=UPI0030F5ED39